MYGLKRLSPLQLQPILTALQIKEQLSLPLSDVSRDAQLVARGVVARERVEDYTSYAMLTQQWELSLDWWLRQFHLPKFPVVQVDAVEYRADRNEPATWTALDPSDYELDDSREPATLTLLLYSLPTLADLTPRVRIRFTAGHADKTEIPRTLIDATLKVTEDLDRFRGMAEIGDQAEGLQWVLEPYRLPDEFLQYDTMQGILPK